MSESTETNSEIEDETRPQMTDAEFKEYQDRRLKFFKEQSKHLKAEEEFERLQADIEEHKLRKLMSLVKYAQITAPPPTQEETEEAMANPPKERTLKED